MAHRHRHMIRLLSLTAIALLIAACNHEAGDGDAGAADASPQASAPTQQATNDVQAIMNGIAQTLQTEKAVLSKAIKSWSSLTDVDRSQLGDALKEQRRLGDQVETMLRNNPTWTPQRCQWYASVVKPVHDEVVRLRLQLGKAADSPDSSRNHHTQLLLDATGSQDAAKETLRWRSQAPGSPENIATMCIKFGHIKG